MAIKSFINLDEYIKIVKAEKTRPIVIKFSDKGAVSSTMAVALKVFSERNPEFDCFTVDFDTQSAIIKEARKDGFKLPPSELMPAIALFHNGKLVPGYQLWGNNVCALNAWAQYATTFRK